MILAGNSKLSLFGNNLSVQKLKGKVIYYSKTPQSADFGTEQNCTADCEIRRLRVLLYVVNGTKWCITQC